MLSTIPNIVRSVRNRPVRIQCKAIRNASLKCVIALPLAFAASLCAAGPCPSPRQSSWSGSSRRIFCCSGWKLNHPNPALPVTLATWRASSSPMRIGSPAAMAMSCDWHDRSIEMNHHAVSATVRPTVSRPWFRRDHRLVLTKRLADPVALLRIEDQATEPVVDAVAFVERQRVLGDRVEQPAERREGLAVQGVRVGDRLHVRPGRVHPGMDVEAGQVDQALTFDKPPVLVDQQEVRDADVLERHSERVDPEAVRVDRIAGRDVPARTLPEAELPEQAEGRRQLALAAEAVLLG